MKQVLGYYLLLINAIGLLIMCIDKLLAKKQARRVPERTLLWVAALGGSFGSLLGMMLALDVFAVAAIRSDAYFGIHERPVASIVLFAFVAVLNLGVAIARFAAGEPLLENGLLTRTSSMNLILGIAFVPVTAASIVSAVRARREDA